MTQKAEAMAIKKDVNMGTLIPIVVFLLAQSTGGIWWASKVTSSVIELKEDMEDLTQDEAVMWSRLYTVEGTVAQTNGNAKALQATLSAMENNIQQLQSDQRETNALLRELLRTVPRPHDITP